MPPLGLAASLGLGAPRAATSSGSAAPAAGFSNTYSVSFDGTDDWVSCGDMADLDGVEALTIAMWIYMDVDGNMTFSTNNSLTDGIFIQTFGGNLYFGVGSGFITLTGARPSLSAWHHLCCVYDVSIATRRGAVYVDGAVATVTAGALATTSHASAGDDVYIGRYNAGGGSYEWNGKLDEVAVWDVALSAAQVTNIYKGETSGGSGGTNGTPGDLASFSPLGWWRMGDGDTFPTLTNHGSTGATNNGTMINMESGDIVEDVP